MPWIMNVRLAALPVFPENQSKIWEDKQFKSTNWELRRTFQCKEKKYIFAGTKFGTNVSQEIELITRRSMFSTFSFFHMKTRCFSKKYSTTEHKFCLNKTQITGLTIWVSWTNHEIQTVRLDDLIAPNSHATFFYF